MNTIRSLAFDCVLVMTWMVAAAGSGITPSVSSVDPARPGANAAGQWITINGSGFVSDSEVILRREESTYLIPRDQIIFVSSIQLKVEVTLAEDGRWSVQVKNSGDQLSSWFSFMVEPTASPYVDRFDFPVQPLAEWTVYAEGEFGHFRVSADGYHSGEDWNLKSGEDLGKPVYAVARGRVTHKTDLGSLGWCVVIKHEAGPGRSFRIPGRVTPAWSYAEECVSEIFSVYIHINHLPDAISVGGSVNRGGVVGYIMNPSGGPHLHVEIRHPDAQHSSGGSMLLPVSNWAPNGTAYTNGHYLDMQTLVDSGGRDPSGFISANAVQEWGSYGSSEGEFAYPISIAAGPWGDIYVTEAGNEGRVQRFASDGTFIASWEGFDSPTSIAVDLSGYVYISDIHANYVQKLTSDGEPVLGWGDQGSGKIEFNRPASVAVDGAGYLYVAGNFNRIKKFDPNGNPVPSLWDDFQGPSNPLNYEDLEIAVTKTSEVYVSTSIDDSVRKFTSDGQLLDTLGGYGYELGKFRFPNGLGVDSSGNLYVADSGNDRIQKFSADGRFLTAFGSSGSGPGEFDHPYDVAVNSRGYMYVTDTESHRVQKLWMGDVCQVAGDYPEAVWAPAHPDHYASSERPEKHPISYIVIHIAQGTYHGTICWSQLSVKERQDEYDRQGMSERAVPSAAHYVVSSDGQVTQMVRHKDIAFHAGNWDYNAVSIGIEHEGYVDQATYFTAEMYQASATLVRYLVGLYAIPKDRSHIIGHDEVPCATHTDPGPWWNWEYYMALVTGISAPEIDQTTGEVTLRWSSRPGKTYSVHYSNDLLTWEIAAHNIVSAGDALTSWVDPTAPLLSPEVTSRYYRIKENH